MHYYQFNIGDYAKSTLHLSPMEDLAYRRLLDRYYDTEKPLESDIEKLCRFIRMSEYKKETQQILEEFFTMTKKGWIQKRVARELASYSLKADTARANGKLGGRPKKTQSVSSGNPDLTQEKAKQEPLTNNQEPLDISLSSSIDDSYEKPKVERIPYQQIVDLYHEKCPELMKVSKLHETRKRQIKARWVDKDFKSNSLDFWDWYFTTVSKSDFLCGRKTDFKADFQWLTKLENFIKVMEGKYV